MIKTGMKVVAGLLLLLGIVYLLGPRVKYDRVPAAKYTPLDVPLEELDAYVAAQESKIDQLKTGNEAKIVWYDGKQKTPYSIVYLHGFSASQEEGAPVHREFAQRYGANLYLSRLADHGRSSKESFKNLTPAEYVASAQKALAIGHAIGEKVIIISCSTGGTLSAYLASEPANEIAGQIFYSPNFDLHDPMAELILYPWAEQLMRQVSGGDYRHVHYDSEAPKYWNDIYHINGAMVVKHLIDQTMTPEVWSRNETPMFIGYYYKNDGAKDEVVSIPTMHQFYEKVSTPSDQKWIEAFPEVGSHVICSSIMSQDLQSVRDRTFAFAEKVLGLKVVEPAPEN